MTTLANLTTYFAGESASFLSAIEKSRGGLRALVKELDPVSAATDKFNKQQALLENGLKRGQLTAEQHATAIGRLRTRYDEQIASLTRLNGSTGAARAGMQQLSFQIGDVATSLAGGAAPLQVFGQQIFQVIGALQLMQKESRGLIGFLGGPWGAALTSAVILLTPLVMKMFEAGDAAAEMKDRMADAADGADAWGDAQSLLGKMVQLTTGKIKDQNDAMRASILYQATLSKIQAADEERKARKQITEQASRTSTTVGMFSPTAGGVGARGTSQALANAELSLIGQGVLSGATKPSVALEQLQALQKEGKITQKVYTDLGAQIVEFGQAAEKGKASQAILDFLETGKLDSRLRQDKPDRKRREKADREAQQLERFTRELQSLQDDELGLRQQLTEDVGIQAMLEHQRVARASEAYATELAARVQQKELTQAQADALLSQRQINDAKRNSVINWRLDDQLTAQDLALKRDELNAQATFLQGQLNMARTAEERRRLQLAMLASETELRRLTLESVLTRHDTNEAEKEIARRALARLDAERVQQAVQIDRQNAGPLAQMLDGIPRTAAEINESFELIATDGLASLNDGLAQAIAGTRSFGDVFSNITDQIVADILRIVIQQQLIKPLAGLLGGGGGGGGLFGSISKLFGAGGGDWASGIGGGDPLGLSGLGLPGFANGGSFQIGGKGGIDQNVLSINGIPRAMVSASEIVNIKPASDMRGDRPVIIRIVGEESSAFAPRVAGISGETSAVQVETAQRRSALRNRQRLR